MNLSALLALMLVAAPSWALRRPTTSADMAKLKDIQLLMDKFNLNLAEEKRHKEAIEILRTPALERMQPDFSAIRKHLNDIATLQTARKTLGPTILRQTVEIYQLQMQPANPIVNYPGRYQDQPSPWTAIYLVTPEREITDPATNQKKKFQLPNLKKGNWREGYTWRDGVISVFDEAFSSPAMLAATIVHESVHYEHIISPNSRKNPPTPLTSEKIARLRLQDIDVRDDLLLSPNERKLLDEQYRRFVQSPNDYVGSEVPSEGNSIRTDLSSDFSVDSGALRAIYGDAEALDSQVQREEAGRLAEAEAISATHMRARAEHVFIVNEAQRCGLTLENSLEVRFRSADNLPVLLQYHGLESFKASLLLAWVCGRPEDSPPCNDSMALLASRWDDPDFKNQLLLREGTTPYGARCVAHMVGRLKNPRSYSDLVKEKKRFLKEFGGTPTPSSNPPAQVNSPRTPPAEREPTPPPPDRPRCRYQGDWCK